MYTNNQKCQNEPYKPENKIIKNQKLFSSIQSDVTKFQIETLTNRHYAKLNNYDGNI